MKVEMLAIDAVLPYGKNPRRNAKAVDAVASSLKQFGWKQPIVVDSEKVIIVGHTRWLAAKKLGMDKVPVVVAKDLSPDKVKAYRIADNKTNEIAEWDVGLLSDELKELSEAGWNDFSGLAFSTSEIDALLSPLAAETFTQERPTLATAAAEQMPEQHDDGEGDDDGDSEDEPPDYVNGEFGDRSAEDYDEDARPDNSIKTYADNVTFSSSNWLGFPDLREDMLWDGAVRKVYIIDGDEAPHQLIVYSTVGMDERITGHVVTFYTEDDRFDTAIWGKSGAFVEKMDRCKPAALVVPDFSTGYLDPTALNIWQTYRARHTARFWQEAGHRVALNIQSLSKKDWDWMFNGLPKRCPVAFTQMRTTQGDDVLRQNKILAIHEWCKRIDTGVIYVYGAEHREWAEPNLPKQGPKFVWLDSFHKARKAAGLLK
jgi:hypothetical protein